MVLAMAILTALATLVLLFKLFFRDYENFQDCLDSVFKSRLSEVVDEWGGEDLLATLKLGLWIGCGGIVGVGIYAGLSTLIG